MKTPTTQKCTHICFSKTIKYITWDLQFSFTPCHFCYEKVWLLEKNWVTLVILKSTTLEAKLNLTICNRVTYLSQKYDHHQTTYHLIDVPKNKWLVSLYKRKLMMQSTLSKSLQESGIGENRTCNLDNDMTKSIV